MEVQKTKYKVVVDGQVSNIEIDLHNFTIIENRKVGRIIHHFPPSTKLSEFHEMLNEIIEFNFNKNGNHGNHE